MRFKPDTFYEMTRCHINNKEYFYCSPRGDMIPFCETGCPFTAYRFDRFGYFSEHWYSNIKEIEGMQMCWVYDIRFDEMDALICLPLDLPEMERYYENHSGSSPLLHTLSEFHAFMMDNGLDQLEIPELGCITSDGTFFPREYSPIHKLIGKDFFDDPEVCELYGITETDVIDYFLSGDFQPWEKLPWDHCYYKYGSYVFYISTRRELTNIDAEPCWFEWTEEYNCYRMVSSPGAVIPAKAEAMINDPKVGCLYNCSENILDVALWEGEPSDSVCSLGEALAHVMDDSDEDGISIGDWEFILDYENKRIHYNGPRTFVEDETKWPFPELANRISFE